MGRAKFFFQDENFDVNVDDVDYVVDVSAEAEGWYTPARMYMRNGDPGYPAEEGFEITKLEIGGIGLFNFLKDSPEIEVSDELRAKITEVVEESLSEMDISHWDSEVERR